jgi:hypothetical protein
MANEVTIVGPEMTTWMNGASFCRMICPKIIWLNPFAVLRQTSCISEDKLLQLLQATGKFL